ncbi:hypothetical protein D1007_08135 [Hordeum vulgare]|uniref:Predicted protein n=1 Tax=Hordeum vulgare subsp. vulgare TaxID=112509 RepID=F2DG03_HORVV|nr:uncharacterized protein LOC123443344 [Hordeum vulgare subsp. vulgare]KAE8814613.1 hypothetical protein D1007_08135 [Hordeum vulgare]KAI5018699.1 hypothetical protein ZWY2020_043587 [Hordeum vulgare]BAJ94024.1 predicted protein [Hordeum vulgare subsp. vulgare]
MGTLQHTALTPSPLCCCSYALLHPRARKISPRFPDGAFSMAKPPFLRRELPERGGALACRMVGRRRLGVAGAGKGPFFGGGRRQGSTGRVVGNLAFVALVAYLVVSGQFRWLLDAIVSLWLITVLLPIVGLGALIFFAQRNILQSDCPNCGKSFRILKTSLKNGPQFCPYCTQPFSVQGNKFVRESASFSSGRRTPTNAQQAFNELFNRGSNGKAPSGSGTIVDVEAEVTDIE